MSPVNDTPVVEEDSKKMQPTVEMGKKRKAETEATEFKVPFYQILDLQVLMANRIPPNLPRSRKLSTTYNI
jgi:hypothetical protein